MRHHHIPQASALMLAVLLLFLPLSGCNRKEQTARVALILSEGEGHYWENIAEGAQTAAQRMNVQLEIYRPDRESGVLAEDLPEKALEDGMNVIVAATQGERKITAALEEIRLPVVAVGTELVLQERISTVLNDDVKMGDNMARALGNRLQEGDTVLLLTDSAESLSGETELRQRLEQMGVTVQGRIFCGDSRDWAYRQTLQQLYLLPDLDAIVVFSAKATVGVAAAVKYLRRDVAIVGTDVVTELIECIEDGTVSATIVRNSFGMGYLGVEYAAEALRGNAVPDERTLASVVVTRDNLFTAEIEKIVFPYE